MRQRHPPYVDSNAGSGLTSVIGSNPARDDVVPAGTGAARNAFALKTSSGGPVVPCRAYNTGAVMNRLLNVLVSMPSIRPAAMPSNISRSFVLM